MSCGGAGGIIARGHIAAAHRIRRAEMDEAAAGGAVGDQTAEPQAAAVATSAPAGADAGAAAVEDGCAKGDKPKTQKKKKKKSEKAKGQGGAAVPAGGDLATAPTQPQSPSPGGDDGGDSASSVESVATQKKTTKKKSREETEDQSGAQGERRSARALGDAPPDEEGLGELALKARKANKAAKKGKGAAGSAALNTLVDTASGAGGYSAGGQGEEEDPRWTPKVKVDKDNKEKAGHKNRANQKHASGVWDKYSPTGVKLDEEFCKEKTFDHSDGKAWARAPYHRESPG